MMALRLPQALPAALDELPLWQERVRLMVKPRRYEHVLRVAELAREIAEAAALSPEEIAQAYAAGILHDIARDLPESELLRLAPPECDIDSRHPLALHGRAARTLLERWGYRDERVLAAVEDHTTGPRGGNRVAACVYIADVSEPGRGVNADIRELALNDLGAALRRSVTSKVTYLQGKGIPVHPRTLAAYHDLEAYALEAVPALTLATLAEASPPESQRVEPLLAETHLKGSD